MIRSIGAERSFKTSRFGHCRHRGRHRTIHQRDQRPNVRFWSIGQRARSECSGKSLEAQIAAKCRDLHQAIFPAMRDVDPSITIIAPDMAFIVPPNTTLCWVGPPTSTGKDAKGRYYIDCVSFQSLWRHQFHSRRRLGRHAQRFREQPCRAAAQPDRLRQYPSKADRLAALTWALTEFNITTVNNPSLNTPAGYACLSFLNGQFFASIIAWR